jgi:hypothetical protein
MEMYVGLRQKTIAISVLASMLFGGGIVTAEELSPRTGDTGQIIEEARVDRGNNLRGLMILEKSDRPCVVQVYGQVSTVRSYEGRIDLCNGGGPKQAKGANSVKGQVFVSGGGSYATGLRVCMSNSGRVKGWTLFGKSNNSPNTISDSFRRVNCPRDGSGWQRRVDCPDDTKAIGVRAHFQPGSGNRSDILKGMELICE